MDPGAFVAMLLDRLEPAARRDAEVVAAGWTAQLTGARAQWPELPLDGELADTIVASFATRGDLAKFRIADLALAVWARRGDAAGITAFESAYAALLGKLAQRFSSVPADELRQRLRIKLFVDGASGRARIRDYTGFGFLANWLKVIAVHDFIDLVRKDARQRIDPDIDDDALVAIGSPAHDPATRALRGQLGAAVKQALEAAVTTLSPRERNFLRHAHVEGHTLEQIAATYHVHRATVARTLASARAAVLEGTSSRLAQAIGGAELDSVIANLDSQLDLSLTRVLS
jgi:RNA polymerase sigma-70 factor